MLFSAPKVAALLLAAFTQLTSAAALDKRQTPVSASPPPTTDPFYNNPPAGWQFKPPGTVLAQRQVYTTEISAAKQSYQFLYTTRDQNMAAILSIVTVFIPPVPNPSKHVAYSFAYDSAYANCDPSYALQNGSPLTTQGTGIVEAEAVNDALLAGYYVSTSDYEGPRASFTNGLLSGYAVLDSIRAVLTTTKTTGLASSAETIMWGYSGGALASEWAAELLSSYAPGLKVIAAVLGGLTPNVRNVALLINGGLFAGIIPSGVQGLANEFPALQEYINEHLLPSKAALWNQVKTMCLQGDIITYAGQNLLNYFDVGSAALYTPLADSIINKVGIMGLSGQNGRAVPSIPLYFYKGGQDEISAINDTTALYNKYCSQGATIEYDIYPTEEHLELIADGEKNAFAYVQARFLGIPAFPGCFTKEVVAVPIVGAPIIEWPTSAGNVTF